MVRDAANATRYMLSDDGDGLIEGAEIMAAQSNGRKGELRDARLQTIRGLEYAPANPRGWTLLCEIDLASAPNDAAKCMDTAFFIAPFDWYVARRRAVLAADLWPRLDSDVQLAAARRVRLMWNSDNWPDHRVKDALYDVYQAPYGRDLLTAGFAGDKEEMRELDRWLIRQNMYGPNE